MPKQTYSFDGETTDRLSRLADARYRGNRSGTIRAALELLDAVLAGEATAVVDPNNAAALLAAYCRKGTPNV